MAEKSASEKEKEEKKRQCTTLPDSLGLLKHADRDHPNHWPWMPVLLPLVDLVDALADVPEDTAVRPKKKR